MTVTTQTTNKQWRLTAKVDTALCIGDSGSNDTGADKATVKTTDSKLYIPASTLKGIWRHACEAIAQGKGDHVCNSPRAENMCTSNYCVICQIFGSPTLESRIYISDLTPTTDFGEEATVNRSGVTINRNRRVAEDQRLYFTETSIPNAEFEFSGDVSLSNDITDEQMQLLTAGLNYIHAIGSGKTRGLGWINITKQDHTPEPQTANSIKINADGFTELSLEVTLESPILTGGRKPTGKAVEALNYIRGGLIRGALANELLAALENNKPDADFHKLFTEDDTGIFRNCIPASRLLPATAVGCKDTPGFIADGKHGVFDTLIERIISEKADCLYQPNCPYPKCGGRIEAQSGFYEAKNGSHKEKRINTRLLTRVAINRHRKVAEDELLYHLTAIDPIIMKTKKHESEEIKVAKKVVLHGSVRVPSVLVDKVALTLQQNVKRLGGGSSRGLGQVNIAVDNKPPPDSLENRIHNFNKALKRVWQAYASLPNTDIDQYKGDYFTINLQSEAILTAEDGWQRSMVITARMLQKMAACNTEVTCIRSFASYGYAGGWNAAWGLPKETELVTNMGSVFVFHTPDIETWISALQQIENTGIGNRREEGYGEITICDPFHLHIREKLKENKEDIK